VNPPEECPQKWLGHCYQEQRESAFLTSLGGSAKLLASFRTSLREIRLNLPRIGEEELMVAVSQTVDAG